MTNVRISFGLYLYPDGTLHLDFDDLLGDVGDVNIVVNPDGTFAEQTYGDSPTGGYGDIPVILTPIADIHKFLRELYERGQKS